MEYISGVDKYYYLLNLRINDEDLQKMVIEADEIFKQLTKNEKNMFYDEDVPITDEEHRACFNKDNYYDRKQEILRIVQYMCRQERKGKCTSFSITDLQQNKTTAYLTNGKYTKPMVKQCVVCKNPECMLCSRCKKVYYCGKQCQKLQWKEHKQVCVKL